MAYHAVFLKIVIMQFSCSTEDSLLLWLGLTIGILGCKLNLLRAATMISNFNPYTAATKHLQCVFPSKKWETHNYFRLWPTRFENKIVCVSIFGVVFTVFDNIVWCSNSLNTFKEGGCGWSHFPKIIFYIPYDSVVPCHVVRQPIFFTGLSVLQVKGAPGWLF